MFEIFNQGGKQRNENDAQDDKCEISFDDWDISEKISAEDADRWPENPANDIVADKF